ISFFIAILISTGMLVFARRVHPQTLPQGRSQSNLTEDFNSLVADLASQDAVKRAAAAYSLGKGRDKSAAAIPNLIALLGDGTEVDPRAYRKQQYWCNDGKDMSECMSSPGREAAMALSQIGSQSVEPLIGALHASQTLMRENAAWSLGAIRDDRAVKPLIAALQDEASGVRTNAAWALGAYGKRSREDTVEPLIQRLGDHEPRVRQQAAWALGAIGDHRAAQPLSVSLKDEDAMVRQQAAWASGAIRDSASVPGLIESLRDNEAGVR